MRGHELQIGSAFRALALGTVMRLGVEDKESRPDADTGYQPDITPCLNIDILLILKLSGILMNSA